ncbi:MAG: hypothetical protein WC022_03100 [Parcubacteria group bacterium]
MLKKIQVFSNLNKAPDQFCIARISDLIDAGVDIDNLIERIVILSKAIWGDVTDSQCYTWTKDMLKIQFEICPELIYCAFNNDEVIATLTYIRTTQSKAEFKSNWLNKSGDGYLTTHIPTGDVAFGVDLSVLKKSPQKVSDRILLSAILIGVIGEGLKSAYLGARIPSYHKHKEMSVEDYVYGKRKNGKSLDPELYFYMKDGFEIVEIIPEYMDDPASMNYGVLIKWNNPLYRITKTLPFIKPVIRWVGKKMFL